jgi:hypothetical protein
MIDHEHGINAQVIESSIQKIITITATGLIQADNALA